jgi:hypothetical protein
MKKSFAIVAVVCALTGTASAQDDVESGADATEETTTETTEVSTEPTPATTSAAAEGGHGGGYQWGVEASLNSAADLEAVHLLYNLGGNYLDAAVDFNLTDAGDTSWEVELELGYRMQRTLAGRIQPYIKPLVIFAISDEGEAADTELTVGVGGAFGVDFELFPQFTLGTEVGGTFEYTNTDPATIEVDFLTAAINATFWW